MSETFGTFFLKNVLKFYARIQCRGATHPTAAMAGPASGPALCPPACVRLQSPALDLGLAVRHEFTPKIILTLGFQTNISFSANQKSGLYPLPGLQDFPKFRNQYKLGIRTGFVSRQEANLPNPPFCRKI